MNYKLSLYHYEISLIIRSYRASITAYGSRLYWLHVCVCVERYGILLI